MICKFWQSWPVHLSRAVNMLTNIPKILNLKKGESFQIIRPESDQKIWSECCHADFTSVWDHLTCWLSKDVLKQRFLESGLSKSLTFSNCENTLAIMIIFFSKIFKIWWRYHKWNKTWRKCFSFLRYLHLNRELHILTILNRILVTDSQCVNKYP